LPVAWRRSDEMMARMPNLRQSWAVVPIFAFAHVTLVAQASPDERLIREARARSNAAIAAHDVGGVARVWMDNVHVVSSTGAQTAGRVANSQRFAEQFKTRPDVVYVRTPSAIEIYPAWNVASERGEWTGRWTEADGALTIGGTYLVQWRKINGTWLIQGELYVPTHCRGGQYCRQRP
jgi:ketosteroid isomerase-like protein